MSCSCPHITVYPQMCSHTLIEHKCAHLWTLQSCTSLKLPSVMASSATRNYGMEATPMPFPFFSGFEFPQCPERTPPSLPSISRHFPLILWLLLVLEPAIGNKEQRRAEGHCGGEPWYWGCSAGWVSHTVSRLLLCPEAFWLETDHWY